MVPSQCCCCWADPHVHTLQFLSCLAVLIVLIDIATASHAVYVWPYMYLLITTLGFGLVLDSEFLGKSSLLSCLTRHPKRI